MGRTLRNLLLQRQHRQIFRRFHYLRNAVGAGFRLGPHDEHPGDTQHSVEDHGKILQKGGNDTGLHHTVIDPESTHQHHQGQAQPQHQGSHGIGNAGDHAGPEADI